MNIIKFVLGPRVFRPDDLYSYTKKKPNFEAKRYVPT